MTPTADGHLLVAGLDVQDCLTIATICGPRAVQTFGGYRRCPHEEELRELAAIRGIALRPVRGGTP